MRAVLERWKERLAPAYQQANRLSGGTLELMRCAAYSFNSVRAGEAATSIAFFALFSLFPLLLVLIAGANLFLDPGTVRGQLLYYMSAILPVSQRFIIETLNAIQSQRSGFGPLALVSLVWAASGVFSTLALHINRAWSEAQVRSFLQSRLVALAMVAVLIGLLFLSLLTTTLLNLFAGLRLPLGGSIQIYQTLLFFALATILPFLIRLGLLYGLYRWVPTTSVSGKAAFIGAITAAVLWEIITRAFTWYLASGFVRYEQLYGSLGTLVALMFYIYLGSQIVLFGAHVTASVSVPEKMKQYQQLKPQALTK
jgi:membrane protein